MLDIKPYSKDRVKNIHSRSQVLNDKEALSVLSEMQADIQERGDVSIKHYTAQFDGVRLDTLFVDKADIKKAYDDCDSELISAMKNAISNIQKYHEKQRPKSWEETRPDGQYFAQRFTALDSAGLYVPGGRAVYPSTVIMNAIPAKIAGVDRLVIATPPKKDGHVAPEILVAADLCGVDEILKVGGAQAVFGIAHGTESIEAVDKIVGPGNKYVTLAKQMVYGLVDIDKPAGPSEVLVYVNDEAYSSFAASEVLAQLEHDPDAIALVVSESTPVLAKIQSELSRQFSLLSRQSIMKESMKNSLLLKTDSVSESIDAINEIASEHLVLLIDDFNPILEQVRHAGSIFCGPWSPVTIGDYYAGTNHVLPTAGAARFSSPLGVMDFCKYSSVVSYQKENLADARDDIKRLTDAEGFDAHMNAVDQRLA